MGLLLLLLALLVAAGVLTAGVWAMLRWEPRLAVPADSLLSEWARAERVRGEEPRHRA